MRNYEDKVSVQLEAGIRVLIYVGTEDWICNWMGNKRWVSSLAWSQRGKFDKAKEQVRPRTTPDTYTNLVHYLLVVKNLVGSLPWALS